MVIINSNKLICLECSSVTCTHFQAYELCFRNHCNVFCAVVSSTITETKYYILNTSTIVLQNKESFHIMKFLAGKWFCDTCTKLCNLKKTLEKILTLHQEDLECISVPKNTFESTISSSLIPFSFDSIQSQIYTEQAVNGMNLPHNLIPEVTICENGYQYSISNLKLENIGIVLYLENDVRELAQCKGTYLIIVTTTNISDFFVYSFV